MCYTIGSGSGGFEQPGEVADEGYCGWGSLEVQPVLVLVGFAV